MKCGIYQIRNLVDGKVYIGSSCSLAGRMSAHQSLLNRGIHHSKHLQAAWNKYGRDSFAFEILEICPEADLLNREQWHLDGKKSYERTKGYNSARFSAAPTKGMKMPRTSVAKAIKKRAGFRHVESSKEKIRRARQGITRSVEFRKACAKGHASEPFFAYSVAGEFKGEFFSLYHAAETLRLSPMAIRSVLKGLCSQSNGYVFDYCKNGKHRPPTVIERLREAAKIEKERMALVYLKTSKAVCVIDSKAGTFLEFRSIKAAADSLKISQFTIDKYMKSGKDFKGYIFMQKSCKVMQDENLKKEVS